VSISAIGKGVNLLVLLLTMAVAMPAQQPPQLMPKVVLRIDGREASPAGVPYGKLLVAREGEPFDRQKIRNSIENLYKTGLFADIEARFETDASNQARILFVCTRKWRIGSLRFSPVPGIPRQQLEAAAGLLKSDEPFRADRLPKASDDLKRLLRLHGYFSPQIDIRTQEDSRNAQVDLRFEIASGNPCRVRELQLDVTPKELRKTISANFSGLIFYTPQDMEKRKEKAIKALKKRHYLYPDIQITEKLVVPGNSETDLHIAVDCGYSYVFRFIGMRRKMDLIRTVWERKVIENWDWALEESKARILNYLKNDGYWNSQVQADIAVKGTVKHVIFSVIRGRKYKVGKVSFAGNRVLSETQLREIVRVDELFFDRLFWLRMDSLLADLEAVKNRYRSEGFASVVIDIQTTFVDDRVHILFQLNEKGFQVVDSLQIVGNRAVSAAALLERMKTKAGSPFILTQLNEDIITVQDYYWSQGYDRVEVLPSVGSGKNRSVQLLIREGDLLRMGDLVIIGGSGDQRRLIERLFPMRPGDPLSRIKLQKFRTELDNSSLFSKIEIEPVSVAEGMSHVLIRIQPDRSRFYGFGFGFVVPKNLEYRRSGVRGTAEYQEKNLFNSTSTFAGMAQLTLADLKLKEFPELRGILTLDTPLSLRKNIQSTISVWEENEIFPSYQFNRLGFGASVFKYFSETLYLAWSLRLYRTWLTDLKIPSYGVDRTDRPFDTTAFSLSLVRESRDDPFNPSRGQFLSADMKVGLPLFEKHYTFLKFLWNYQFHTPILKTGVFSLSFRNGFAFGDMSITERFFAGGPHSFRGTSIDRLGPIYQDQYNQPQGGNVLVLLNLETTFPFPFLPIDDLYYTFFVDFGNVFEKSSQLDFRKMEKALGIGLKYKTPLGPIRIEFAWNPREAVEKSFLIQWGLGNVY